MKNIDEEKTDVRILDFLRVTLICMSASEIVAYIIGYFVLLVIVSRLTSGRGDNESFFLGGRSANWMTVSFGMIGASLSGVTFLSVPGWVEGSSFSYMQMVLGYIVGYGLIAFVLLPVYYKLNLTSIYTYLEGRFGKAAYKTGASFFLLSRIIGAAFRLYLVAIVFEEYIFGEEVPFYIIALITIVLIWVYTFKGGIKTIIWTDTLQTSFMLLAVVLAIWGIGDAMGLSITGIVNTVAESDYSKSFYFEDFSDKKHFIKQFLSGAAIAFVMTGLDQDMMQKNLACKNLSDAKKNIITLSIVLVFVNLLFLGLGALLYTYIDFAQIGMPDKADLLFPKVALEGGLGNSIAVIFILGLVASAYSSADSALTALTTSFYVDILGSPNKKSDSDGYSSRALDSTQMTEGNGVRIRRWVHVGMSVVLLIVIVIFDLINDQSVISQIFTFAGYTYGPLLGLYTFGLFTRMNVRDSLVPVVCLLSPVLSFLLDTLVYDFGFELLIVNGLLTFLMLLLINTNSASHQYSMHERVW